MIDEKKSCLIIRTDDKIDEKISVDIEKKINLKTLFLKSLKIKKMKIPINENK